MILTCVRTRRSEVERQPKMKERVSNYRSRPTLPAVVCLFAFLSLHTVVAQTPTNGDVGKNLDRYLTSLERFGFSCQVLVARHGQVLLNKGYGLAAIDQHEPVSTRTLYNIASLSKQFTAAAILDLESRGKLNVSDSIAKFLSNLPYDKKEITIQQLLTHTAGIDDDYDRYSRQPYLSKEDFLRSALARPLGSKPGEEFTYSNDGYAFLAAIIESASGETYESYLRKHLFVPAGMKDTGFVGELGGSENRLARTYDGLHESGLARNWSGGLGGSDIVSNTSDLFRWYRAIHSTRILNVKERAEFLRPHTDKTGISLAYGYGWWLETTPRGTHAIWHSGHGNGYSSVFRMLVDEDAVIIFLSSFSIADYPFRESLFPTLKTGPIERIIFGMKYLPPPRGRPLSAAERRELPGIYRLPDGSHLRVGIWAAGISVTPDSQAGFSAMLPHQIEDCSELYDQLGIVIPMPTERVTQLSQLTESVRSFLSALANKHDLESLKKAADENSQFSAGPPFDLFMNTWTTLERQYGAVESVSIQGTYPLLLTKTVMRSVTFSEVRFHSRTIRFEWRWQDGKLVAPVSDVVQPPITPFVPTSTTTFANFDFFMGGSSTIEALSNAAGHVTGLRVGSGKYGVVAKRDQGSE